MQNGYFGKLRALHVMQNAYFGKLRTLHVMQNGYLGKLRALHIKQNHYLGKRRHFVSMTKYLLSLYEQFCTRRKDVEYNVEDYFRFGIIVKRVRMGR